MVEVHIENLLGWMIIERMIDTSILQFLILSNFFEQCQQQFEFAITLPALI